MQRTLLSQFGYIIKILDSSAQKLQTNKYVWLLQPTPKIGTTIPHVRQVVPLTILPILKCVMSSHMPVQKHF